MLVSIAQFQLFFLALTRVLAILAQMPFMGGSTIPLQFRIALGVVLTIVSVPWAPLPTEAAALSLLPFAAAILKELIIGLLAGFAVTLMFGLFQIAGKLMEMSSGFSASQLFNPTIGEMSSSYDQFFMMIIFLYFFVINGDHGFIIGLNKTFQVLPVNSPIDSLTPGNMMQMFTTMITGGFQMALPILGAILLADLTLGLLSRVAPQIQVFFLGLPVKVWMGLAALAIFFSVALPTAGRIINELGPQMIKILGV